MATPGRGRFSTALVLLVILAAVNLSQGHADYVKSPRNAGPTSSDGEVNSFKFEPDSQQSSKPLNLSVLSAYALQIMGRFMNITLTEQKKGYKQRIAELQRQVFVYKNHAKRIRTFQRQFPHLKSRLSGMNRIKNELNTTKVNSTVRDIIGEFNQAAATNDLLAYYVAKTITINSGFQAMLQSMPNNQRLLYETFPVRLTGGKRGKLQVKLGRRWAPVCNDGETQRLYGPVCYHDQFLGQHGVEGLDLTHQVFLSNVKCGGREDHVLLCPDIVMQHETCDREAELDCRIFPKTR